MVTDALVLENVTKRFGDVTAVENLSARLPAGSIYGFLGPNGAGKTTTIRMIMNIFRPDRGMIQVLGSTSIAQVLDGIGYMPEERGLYRKMTVRNILSYIGSIKGMRREEILRAIPVWLEEMGLSGWMDSKVEGLSRGMQQKIQFIATVINDPELVILDEPFSGLDPLNLDLLKDIVIRMRDRGKTVIFSTHMMEQAENLCDRILLINDGKKIIDGTLQEIRAHYESNVVSVELESDSDFINNLPMVKSTRTAGRRLDVILRENINPQEFLQAIVGRARVRAFEVKTPSLHEIFVQLVGSEDREKSS